MDRCAFRRARVFDAARGDEGDRKPAEVRSSEQLGPNNGSHLGNRRHVSAPSGGAIHEESQDATQGPPHTRTRARMTNCKRYSQPFSNTCQNTVNQLPSGQHGWRAQQRAAARKARWRPQHGRALCAQPPARRGAVRAQPPFGPQADRKTKAAAAAVAEATGRKEHEVRAAQLRPISTDVVCDFTGTDHVSMKCRCHGESCSYFSAPKLCSDLRACSHPGRLRATCSAAPTKQCLDHQHGENHNCCRRHSKQRGRVPSMLKLGERH